MNHRRQHQESVARGPILPTAPHLRRVSAVAEQVPSVADDEIVWPPPPHDPRERELALVLDGWEVRLFGGRKFQYFVTRGFWHVQLWHPGARVSVLTPSRLSSGFYEAFPIANWKAQMSTYDELAALVRRETRAALPDRARVEPIERCLVDDVVRAATRPQSILQ